MPRHASTHAAGVVITREPATEYVPLSTNDGLPVTQFNMVEIERLGLLKMDFLGLRTLTVIHDTETAVRHTKDPDFRVANIDYDDPATYEMLTRGETMGIFQLESTGMTQVLMSMRPKNLEDAQQKGPVQGRLPDPADGPHRGCDQRCRHLSGAGHADLP